MKFKYSFPLLIILSSIIGYASHFIGLDIRQSLIMSIFSMSIIATLFFWEFRLSFVFLGSGILLLIHAVDLENFLRFASLDVILFLIGMMIVVGMMKEAGFFTWIVMAILRTENLNGKKLLIIITLVSALLTALMDEVTAIIIMVTLIFDICDFLDIEPVPLVLSCVLATNIGSASTVLGNPIGILIAARGKLAFQDFIVYALPVSFVILIITIGILLFWYHNYLRAISVKLKEVSDNDFFISLITIPPDRKTRISMVIFFVTVLAISLHQNIEHWFGLEKNTLLMILPIISAGIVMLYRHDKARFYVEHEVEWNSLLFFMFLFIQAGVIKSAGIAGVFAQKIIELGGSSIKLLAGLILISGGILSSFLDNVVVVASYIPVIQNIQMLFPSTQTFWWALLFGACFGGNITVIGSTANIIAMGLFEKRFRRKIGFFQWLKIGSIIGFVTMTLAYALIIILPWYRW